MSGETTTYTYNTEDRLTKAVLTGGDDPRTYTATWDDAGNRTKYTISTSPTPYSLDLDFNSGNEVSSANWSYDGAGNLTASPGRTATYNAAGQQTKVTVNDKDGNPVTTTYKYAGTNQNELLTTSTSGGTTYKYAYGRPDANGPPEIERIDTSGDITGTAYVFHDPSGQPVMLQTTANTTCLYVYSGVNNPVIISTSNSNTAQSVHFDPFGSSARVDSGYNTAWSENPYGFGEGIYDRATQRIKFGTRWYSSASTAWTQQDTLNAPLDPKNANRYAYAGGDPVNHSDPTGANAFSDAFSDAVGGALLGIATVAVGASFATGFGEIAAGAFLAGSADVAAGGLVGATSTFSGYQVINS